MLCHSEAERQVNKYSESADMQSRPVRVTKSFRLDLVVVPFDLNGIPFDSELRDIDFPE
jgi:hypothetical protein